MGEPKHPELFPIAYGNEEETMMMAGAVGASTKNFHPAYTFLGGFAYNLPTGVKTVSNEAQVYTQAGGLFYRTGRGGSLFEGATPECSTPEEIAVAIQARERTMVHAVGQHITKSYKNDEAQEVRIQRRTVDGIGNSAASHDSFEMRRPSWMVRYFGSDARTNSAIRLALLSHASTRSFMTGAGYVNDKGMFFAQKPQTLTHLEGYGYFSSVYRVTGAEDTGARFELRCNDDNISPWSIETRVGGTALVLTALQTELVGGISSRIPRMIRGNHNQKLMAFRLFNVAHLDGQGRLWANRFTHEAVDFQEWQFTLIGKHLSKYVELGGDYMEIVEEAIQYCHDFRKVAAGEAELSLLADRSDNAVKFQAVTRSVRRDREVGMMRSTNDVKAQMKDMRYDVIRISPGLGGAPRTEYGYGYKWRDSGRFRKTPSEKAVERAMYYPPTSTRAHVRGNLIRRGKIGTTTWSSVRVATNAEGLEPLRGQKVALPSVVLDAEDRALSPEEYLYKVAPGRLSQPGLGKEE